MPQGPAEDAAGAGGAGWRIRRVRRQGGRPRVVPAARKVSGGDRGWFWHRLEELVAPAAPMEPAESSGGGVGTGWRIGRHQWVPREPLNPRSAAAGSGRSTGSTCRHRLLLEESSAEPGGAAGAGEAGWRRRWDRREPGKDRAALGCAAVAGGGTDGCGRRLWGSKEIEEDRRRPRGNPRMRSGRRGGRETLTLALIPC